MTQFGFLIFIYKPHKHKFYNFNVINFFLSDKKNIQK